MKRLLSVLLMVLAFPVAAQNYPNKIVKIIAEDIEETTSIVVFGIAGCTVDA